MSILTGSWKTAEQRQLQEGGNGTFQLRRTDPVRSRDTTFGEEPGMSPAGLKYQTRDPGLPESWPAKQIKDLP
jgi:hypothetical protein